MEYFAELDSYEARKEYEEWLDRDLMGGTTQYFKIVRPDGGIFDIVVAESSSQAHDEHPGFLVKPATQDEWWTWRTTNWSQIDSMEREMNQLDSF